MFIWMASAPAATSDSHDRRHVAQPVEERVLVEHAVVDGHVQAVAGRSEEPVQARQLGWVHESVHGHVRCPPSMSMPKRSRMWRMLSATAAACSASERSRTRAPDTGELVEERTREPTQQGEVRAPQDEVLEPAAPARGDRSRRSPRPSSRAHAPAAGRPRERRPRRSASALRPVAFQQHLEARSSGRPDDARRRPAMRRGHAASRGKSRPPPMASSDVEPSAGHPSDAEHEVRRLLGEGAERRPLALQPSRRPAGSEPGRSTRVHGVVPAHLVRRLAVAGKERPNARERGHDRRPVHRAAREQLAQRVQDVVGLLGRADRGVRVPDRAPPWSPRAPFPATGRRCRCAGPSSRSTPCARRGRPSRSGSSMTRWLPFTPLMRCGSAHPAPCW